MKQIKQVDFISKETTSITNDNISDIEVTNSRNLIIEAIENTKTKSKWQAGVRDYALELLENLPDKWAYSNDNLLHKELLNGASDWEAYSWGGASLIYDGDICDRLATESEKKPLETAKDNQINGNNG